MDKKVSKGISSIIFRLVVSLLVFGATMAIVGYLYDVFGYINLSSVPNFTVGVLKFFLGALSFVGVLSLVLYLSSWIFNGLIDNDI